MNKGSKRRHSWVRSSPQNRSGASIRFRIVAHYSHSNGIGADRIAPDENHTRRHPFDPARQPRPFAASHSFYTIDNREIDRPDSYLIRRDARHAITGIAW